MIPLFLSINNFMRHDKSDIDFSKLDSIIFIIGNENGSTRKSNAVGKTTIFHAIRFALFNVSSAKKITKTIRRGEKKCDVLFIFQMSDGCIYKVYRHLSEKINGVNFYKKEGEKWKDLTCRTATDTNAQILNVIKTNVITFENTSYFKQSDLMNLAKAKTEKRKEIISSLLELGVWEKYRELCKKKKEPVDIELNTINSKILELQFSEGSLLSLKQKHEEIIETKKEKEKELNELRKDFSNKKDKLNNLKLLIGDKKQVETKYNDASLYFQECKDNLQYIKESIKGTLDVIEDDNKNLLKKKSLLKLKTEELTNLIKSMPEEIEEKIYDKEQNNLAKFKMKLKEKIALCKMLEKPLPESASCPECSTLLDDDKRDELIKNKRQEVKKTKKEINEFEILTLESEEKIKEIEKTLLIYKTAKNKNSQINNEIAILNFDIEGFEKNTNANSTRIETLKTREIRAFEALKKAENSYNEAKELKVSFMRNDHLKEVDLLNAELSELSIIGKENSKKVQDLSTEFGRSLEKINQTEKNVEAFKLLINKKEELEYMIRIYDAANFSFSSKGIPFMIINSVLDAIQEETNKVLKLLRGNMQTQFVINKVREKDGEIQDTLDMRFFVNTEEWEYDELSGGQQGSVALALKFAMAVVNRKRCGADIKLLLLDEVDQPLDEESLDSFYEILKLWSKDMVIMVVTHNKQLKEKLEKYILVTKQNKTSSAIIIG